jgi:hypothetical protein
MLPNSGVYVLTRFSDTVFSSHDSDEIIVKYNKATPILLVSPCDEALGSPAGSAHHGPVPLEGMDVPTAVRCGGVLAAFLFRARDGKVVVEPLECGRYIINIVRRS